MQRLRKDAPHGIRDAGVTRELCLIADAYRAGAQWALNQRGAATEAELQQRADQELEACCEWLKAEGSPGTVIDLRAARRPTPPSDADQALEALNQMDEPLGVVTASRASIIRRALERLKELEPQP